MSVWPPMWRAGSRGRNWLASLRLAPALLHGDEDEADSGGEQQVHGLVQQFGREDAPDKQVVAQRRHQHDVGRRRHWAQERQAVAAVAHRHRAPEEEEWKRDRRKREKRRRSGDFAATKTNKSVKVPQSHPELVSPHKMMNWMSKVELRLWFWTPFTVRKKSLIQLSSGNNTDCWQHCK